MAGSAGVLVVSGFGTLALGAALLLWGLASVKELSKKLASACLKALGPI